MNRCNYCTFRSILRFASNAGLEVYVVPIDSRSQLKSVSADAVEVYTSPPDKLDFEWVSTMLKLTDHCVC